MGPPSQKILNWLHNVLTSDYRYVDRAYSDVAQTLSHHPWVSLRTDVYTFEQGHSSLLLNLYGALPITFRGTNYAFPISIWIPREYPQAAPMQFVTPTKDMMVRPGQYVSGEGRIYHPYLAGWRIERSSIVGFIAILQDIFGKEPPLIARTEQISRPLPVPQRNGAPPPVPPLPPELGRPHNLATQLSADPGGAPPPPPKPFDAQRQTFARTTAPPMPASPSRASPQSHPPSNAWPDGYGRDTQHKPQIPVQRAGSAWDGRESLPWHTSDQSNRTYPSQQGPISPMSPPRPQTMTATHSPLSPEPRHPQQALQPQMNPTYSTRPSQAIPQVYGQNPPAQQGFNQQPVPQAYHHHQHLQQDQRVQAPKSKPPEDLLTSPFEATLPLQTANVAPPPIPRNPQKDALLSTLSQTLSEQVRSIYASNISAIAPLRAQQAALTTTLDNVNTEISQLDELEKMLDSNETILHQAMRDADAVLEDAKKRQVPNVDDVLCAPTVVARQLYEAVADERAIEDCRGLLMKALDKGRVNGGVWAKQTRGLAREEFLKKALIKKIARGMGLIEEDHWI